jgi:hypothetical protein
LTGLPAGSFGDCDGGAFVVAPGAAFAGSRTGSREVMFGIVGAVRGDGGGAGGCCGDGGMGGGEVGGGGVVTTAGGTCTGGC